MEEIGINRTLGAFSMGSDAVRTHSRVFWEGQAGLLGHTQAFLNGWFQRRQAGTKAAMEAAEAMCRASTPGEWVVEYQKWLTGALERIGADGLALQQQLRNVGEEAGASLVPTADQDHDTGAQDKEKKRMPATTR